MAPDWSWAKKLGERLQGRVSGEASAGTPAEPSLPIMAPEEIRLLKDALKASRRYLEFGSGGSTVLAIETPVEKCWSVESDPKWIAEMRRWDVIRNAEASGQLHLHHADIGKVQTLGVPVDRTAQNNWSRYFLDIWGKFDAPPDLVLVDGRFRLACCIATLLACPPETVLLIHDFGDFTKFRKNYRLVLDFADVVESARSLASLHRKPDFSPMKALAVLDLARTDLV